MSNSDSLKIEHRSGIYYLSGALDEYADFTELKEESGTVYLDTSGVTWCNSIGLREMMHLITTWKVEKLIYKNCSVCFIEQINQLPALLGFAKCKGSVESLSVPFSCPDCSNEDERVYQYDQLVEIFDSGNVPEKHCSSCNSLMEFDELSCLFITEEAS